MLEWLAWKEKVRQKIHVGNTGHQNGYRSGETYFAMNAMLSLPTWVK